MLCVTMTVVMPNVRTTSSVSRMTSSAAAGSSAAVCSSSSSTLVVPSVAMTSANRLALAARQQRHPVVEALLEAEPEHGQALARGLPDAGIDREAEAGAARCARSRWRCSR